MQPGQAPASLLGHVCKLQCLQNPVTMFKLIHWSDGCMRGKRSHPHWQRQDSRSSCGDQRSKRALPWSPLLHSLFANDLGQSVNTPDHGLFRDYSNVSYSTCWQYYPTPPTPATQILKQRNGCLCRWIWSFSFHSLMTRSRSCGPKSFILISERLVIAEMCISAPG